MFLCIKFTIFCCLLKIRISSEWHDEFHRLFNHFALAYILILCFMLSKMRLLFHPCFFFWRVHFSTQVIKFITNAKPWTRNCCHDLMLPNKLIFLFVLYIVRHRVLSGKCSHSIFLFLFVYLFEWKLMPKRNFFLSHICDNISTTFFSLNNLTNQIFQVKIQRKIKMGLNFAPFHFIHIWWCNKCT